MEKSYLVTFLSFQRLIARANHAKRGGKMIYRRKVYKITSETFEEFTHFFHTYLLPNQLKHGARLVGRWVTEGKDEVTAIWEYDSFEEYTRIEEAVRNDDLHRVAQEKRQELKDI
jgi:8-oxo-dGTP diphosphatase